jgi:hypothetical protein
MEEPTRRNFIRNVGVTLASLLLSGCGATRRTPTPPIVTCYTVTPATRAPTPSQPPSSSWSALRGCWLSLQDPQLQSFEDTDFSKGLRQQHTEALDALVASGELERAVAAEIGVAFEQAVAHVQRQMATCYIALPPEYMPRQDLMQQAAALEEMAEQSQIDQATVAQAQEAMQRDVEWLAQFGAGQTPGKLEEIQATPQAVEAARILVELLLSK